MTEEPRKTKSTLVIAGTSKKDAIKSAILGKVHQNIAAAVKGEVIVKKRTAAGLPEGQQWLRHDTGRLGLAAKRRKKQMERQELRRKAREQKETQ